LAITALRANGKQPDDTAAASLPELPPVILCLCREEQLELIKQVGEAHYLAQQIKDADA